MQLSKLKLDQINPSSNKFERNIDSIILKQTKFLNVNHKKNKSMYANTPVLNSRQNLKEGDDLEDLYIASNDIQIVSQEMMILDTEHNTNTTKNRNVSYLLDGGDRFQRKKLNPYYSKKYHKKSQMSQSLKKDVALIDSNLKLQPKPSQINMNIPSQK